MFLIVFFFFVFIGAFFLVGLHYVLFYLSNGRIELISNEPVRASRRGRTSWKHPPFF